VGEAADRGVGRTTYISLFQRAMEENDGERQDSLWMKMQIQIMDSKAKTRHTLTNDDSDVRSSYTKVPMACTDNAGPTEMEQLPALFPLGRQMRRYSKTYIAFYGARGATVERGILGIITFFTTFPSTDGAAPFFGLLPLSAVEPDLTGSELPHDP
jgi:hypothetical protein